MSSPAHFIVPDGMLHLRKPYCPSAQTLQLVKDFALHGRISIRLARPQQAAFVYSKGTGKVDCKKNWRRGEKLRYQFIF